MVSSVYLWAVLARRDWMKLLTTYTTPLESVKGSGEAEGTT